MDNLDFSDKQLSLFCYRGYEPAMMEVISSDTREEIVYLDYGSMKTTFPRLAADFQTDPVMGGAKLILLTKSVCTGISLGRHVMTGSYYVKDHDEMYDLLVHVELYYLAVKYDMTNLLNEARMQVELRTPAVGVIRELPYNLFSSISLIYEYEPLLDHLKGSVLLFCITHFKEYLSQNADFKELLQENPRIVIDLCATSFHRNFMDNCAGDLIRLPTRTENMTEDQIEFSNFLQRLFLEMPMDAARRRAPPDASFGVIEAAEAEDSAVDEVDGVTEDFVVLSLRSVNTDQGGEVGEGEDDFVVIC